MPTPPTEDQLIPGDVLLYSGNSPISWLIKIKTFSPISHVEMYAGSGVSYASRDGEGVGTYPLRFSQLHSVQRPLVPLTPAEWEVMDTTQDAYLGSGYDWRGLFGFFSTRHRATDDTKAFCSEHVARMFKLAGRPLFGRGYPSDKVSPGMFLSTPLLEQVWPLPE